MPRLLDDSCHNASPEVDLTAALAPVSLKEGADNGSEVTEGPARNLQKELNHGDCWETD